MVRPSRHIIPPSGKSLPLGAMATRCRCLDSYNRRRYPPILATSYLAMPGVQGGQGIEDGSHIAYIDYILSSKPYTNQGRRYSPSISPSKGALTRPSILPGFPRLLIPCY
jgi:hypothetical protein